MVELKHLQAENLLLSREQLKELDSFQARFAGLERELSGLVEEFQNILNRHYFNREIGYLDEQQQNLREVVQLQSKLEKLAGLVSSRSGDLKTFMVGLQQSLQGLPPREAAPEVLPEAPSGEQAGQTKLAPKPAPARGEKASATSPLVSRSRESLADGATSGGEVSLKLLFEELKLAVARNSEIVNEISKSLRKLLYDRQLVGYSKTSLVFGKDKTLDQLLEILKPIFMAEALQSLLLEMRLIEAGERDKATLACNRNRELIYLIFD